MKQIPKMPKNAVDPDQLASVETCQSGSTVFSPLIENVCLHQSGSLQDIKKVHIKRIQHDKG